MDTVNKVAIVCGSLKKTSTNAGLLRAIESSNSPVFKFEWVDIHHFPVFNEDIEEKGIPSSVQKARDQIKGSDAVLFGVDEVNGSVSGPLKNAYDWLSRDDNNKFCPMTDKIGAMVSSAVSDGGSKAQSHFRQIVSYRKMKILEPSSSGELQIKKFSGSYFDNNGNLIDSKTKEKRIPQFLKEFDKFIKSGGEHHSGCCTQ